MKLCSIYVILIFVAHSSCQVTESADENEYLIVDFYSSRNEDIIASAVIDFNDRIIIVKNSALEGIIAKPPPPGITEDQYRDRQDSLITEVFHVTKGEIDSIKNIIQEFGKEEYISKTDNIIYDGIGISLLEIRKNGKEFFVTRLVNDASEKHRRLFLSLVSTLIANGSKNAAFFKSFVVGSP